MEEYGGVIMIKKCEVCFYDGEIRINKREYNQKLSFKENFDNNYERIADGNYAESRDYFDTWEEAKNFVEANKNKINIDIYSSVGSYFKFSFADIEEVVWNEEIEEFEYIGSGEIILPDEDEVDRLLGKEYEDELEEDELDDEELNDDEFEF